MRATATDLSTFRRYVKVDASGCWIWTGRHDRDGYPVARLDGREMGVHRWAYLTHVGPIPEGYAIDHRCHTEAVAAGLCSADLSRCQHRSCVCPGHLEPVTTGENTRRSDHAHRRKTECAQGHPYSPENTRTDKRGKRVCLTCDRERKKQPVHD